MSPAGLPALPDPLTLAALQAYVRAVVTARGFTRDLERVFILMVEEVGELATEFRRRAREPDRFDPANLAYEIIDILLYLLDVANGFGLELEDLWPRHGTAAPPGLPLNVLARHAAAGRGDPGGGDSDELLAVLLCEQVGELAREVRKTWKGRADPELAGGALVAALLCLFRIGDRMGVDFEAALAEKERENAARSWAY